MSNSTPKGRFAPTPSGPLHLGSLVTALAGWLDMRVRGGEWWVRIDDLDQVREVPGAADTQLRQLDALGLTWDGPVLYQSTRQDAYQAALEQLLKSGHAFYCSLSRTQLEALGHRHPGPSCAVDPAPDTAIRLVAPEQPVQLPDRFAGTQTFDIQALEGAFVIRRRDGFFAYQLGSAVDDSELGFTDILRGDDLLYSSAKQYWIMQCLNRPPPRYAHLPTVRDERGNKLSKSAGSAALDIRHPVKELQRALHCLNLPVPDTDQRDELLNAAQAAWKNHYPVPSSVNQA